MRLGYTAEPAFAFRSTQTKIFGGNTQGVGDGLNALQGQPGLRGPQQAQQPANQARIWLSTGA